MTALSRRTMLATAAAGLAAAALPARAATPPTRFKHGAYDVIVVSDGHLELPVEFLATDAPREERDATFKESGISGPQYSIPTNVTLLKRGDELTLIDMGSGGRFMPTAGKLWENLEAAGIDKTKIAQVIFTHGHPDHLWGAIDEFDDLQIPNATFHVAANEWNFWEGDNALRSIAPERAGFVTGARRNYAAIKDKVKTMKPGDEVLPGVHVIDTPGHTQGHVSLALPGGDGLVIGGDVLTHPIISFRHPEWRPATDHVPEQAVETRKKLLDRMASERSTLIGFHLPYPGRGMVERKDGAYRFVPLV
jgi:glyoxylase-like metal-dependent hydrolase (beta-lactamase superfamily II)